MVTHALHLDQLAEQIARAVPKFGPAERRIAVATYRLLAGGEPVPQHRLAEVTGLAERTVQDVLRRWTGVFYDDQCAIIGFWGLAIPEMPHRFTVHGRRLHTWCAFDSLFIPEILNATARVESPDPVTKEKITLTVGPRGIREAEPRGAVMSFLAPREAFDQNVIINFCHFVHFFASTDSGQTWTARHDGTFLLTLDEAVRLARLTNARNFPEELR